MLTPASPSAKLDHLPTPASRPLTDTFYHFSGIFMGPWKISFIGSSLFQGEQSCWHEMYKMYKTWMQMCGIPPRLFPLCSVNSSKPKILLALLLMGILLRTRQKASLSFQGQATMWAHRWIYPGTSYILIDFPPLNWIGCSLCVVW